MDHLMESAVNASSFFVSSIVSSVMETTNQLMSRRLMDEVSSEAGSTESADNQFLILTEDHFSELADEDLDPSGLPVDQKDVERAIRRYMKLIRCEETDSEKKKKLIIKLCDLRVRLSQLNDEMDQKYLNGHRFNNKPNSGSSDARSGNSLLPVTSSSGLTCDVCLKKQSPILLPAAIFKTYQPNLILSCDFCDFKIHRNCMNSVSYVRRCPRLLFHEEQEQLEGDEQPSLQQQERLHSCTSDANDSPVNHLHHATSASKGIDHANVTSNSVTTNHSTTGMSTGQKVVKYSQYLIFSICPEVGLSKQSFKCADCEEAITFSTSRICDYDGLYYCFSCHWNDQERTSARILHNWDAEMRPVSRRSLQLITFIKRQPVLFDVLDFNPMLYGLVEDLPFIKRLRLELTQMANYIRVCRQPAKPKLMVPSYLISEEESSGGNAFSLNDLINLIQLKKQLIELHAQLLAHITVHCEGCRGKGFFCDHCRDKVDLLFPFSANTSSCPDCGTVYHRSCYHRKHKMCTKCQRMKQKLQKSCISEDGSQEEIREPEQQTNTHSFPTPAGDADADEGQQKRQQEEADHDVE